MNKFVLTFDKAQLQVLSSALVELPYRVAQPLVQHINAEIQKNFDAAVDSRDTADGVDKV